MSVSLIIGRAAGVWEEVEVAKALIHPIEPIIIAINKAGRDYPGMVSSWVSYHPDLFVGWLKQRRDKGLPDHAAVLWSGIYRGQRCGSGKVALPIRYVPSTGGSSGLLAVDVALSLGLDKNVLCGIPMEKTARYDDKSPWTEGEVYRAAWLKRADELKGRVRSMSGWTRDLLGAPDKDWLDAPPS